jgi:UDP-N-acetylglucosamine diphosphorylase / glucose-1-phosphate thymidylyltransferase / UDP-N-acetylgalactosamine diphosphorylase / glucosamine-1-phosphate N-acetyltransferase / galactosamine-1-phosphate N-acetyltransferase
MFVLLDVADVRALAPITSARPLAEVRVGARLVRERWELALGRAVDGLVCAPVLRSFEETGAPPVLADDVMLPAGTIVATAHLAPALRRVDFHESVPLLMHASGRVAAVRLDTPVRVDAFRESGLGLDGFEGPLIDGWWLGAPWDVIGHLPAMLAEDARAIAATMAERELPAQIAAIGAHPIRIGDGAQVEPFTILDASKGAIVIEAGAVVRGLSRLTGPFVLGHGSQWLGGEGDTVSVGPVCKARGEISTSIFCGYANKGHDGFLGHSYLGRWVNLGAGTISSNLKNTYGPVSFETRETGLQFLGALIGDHAKTGIGSRLTTGCSVGVGANLIADGVVPSRVKAFAFGTRGARYQRDKFLDMATRAMARRQVVLTDAMRHCLSAVYDETMLD